MATISNGPVAETDSHAALSPDGKTLAIGFATGALLYADTKTGVVLTNIAHAYATNIFQVVFSPDGKFLATAGRELETGRIPAPRIWDVATHEMAKLLSGHSDLILAVAFSPDVKTLASCSVDNSIKFWDIASSKEILPSLGQLDTVVWVAFSPNGRTFATACADGSMRLWSVATRRELAALKINPRTQTISFSPDGQTLAAYDWNGELRLWRAPIAESNRP